MSAGSKRTSVSYLQEEDERNTRGTREEHERNPEILQSNPENLMLLQKINKTMILITKDKNLKENQQNQVI